MFNLTWIYKNNMTNCNGLYVPTTTRAFKMHDALDKLYTIINSFYGCLTRDLAAIKSLQHI